MTLGKRELCTVLLAAAGLVFYMVLLATATSQAQIGGGVTNSSVIIDNDQDNDQDNDDIDCDQILDIVFNGEQTNNQTQNGTATGGAGTGGSGTGGSGSGGSATVSQNATFGDQTVTASQIQNCINGDVNINGDDMTTVMMMTAITAKSSSRSTMRSTMRISRSLRDRMARCWTRPTCRRFPTPGSRIA